MFAYVKVIYSHCQKSLNSTEMEFPMTHDQVTEDWLKSALSHHGETITIKELKSVKNEGGVMSSVFKAKVDIDGKEEKLFTKIMPPDQGQKVIIENHPLDSIKIKTYEKTLPMLQSFELKEMSINKLQEMTCRFFGGKNLCA